MIYYDSHRWSTLFRIHGSVLPKAFVWALPSAIFTFVLKWLEQQGYIDLAALNVLTKGDIYSGFTYVLGFSLVFRTSQAYSRYWTACTAVHEMASEWSDSCASLIAFSANSPAPAAEIFRFRHTLVRLFSLLHGMALSEIAESDLEMPLLDVEGLSKPQLALLASPAAQGKTVQIILCWIKAYICRKSEEGVLNVPAPLLTRTFQEFGSGLLKFHTAQQVGIWPFPFPYTQLTVILIQVYTIITPLVISTWPAIPAVCTIFSFLSVTCMVGLDLIACELEDPFGDDPNDLPLLELQGDMNKFLTMQLDPAINTTPELLSTAVMDHHELAFSCSASSGGRLSLKAVPRKFQVSVKRRDRMRKQKRWCGEESGKELPFMRRIMYRAGSTFHWGGRSGSSSPRASEDLVSHSPEAPYSGSFTPDGTPSVSEKDGASVGAHRPSVISHSDDISWLKTPSFETKLRLEQEEQQWFQQRSSRASSRSRVSYSQAGPQPSDFGRRCMQEKQVLPTVLPSPPHHSSSPHWLAQQDLDFAQKNSKGSEHAPTPPVTSRSRVQSPPAGLGRDSSTLHAVV